MAIVNWKQLHGDQFAGARAAVTGGAGFIGSHLVEALLDLGAEVVVIDDLSGGDVSNFDTFAERAGKRLRFVEGSILDRSLVDSAVAGCRYVFHLAALGSVPRSVEIPEQYHEVNATGTLRVLESARKAGAQRVMFAASSAAYGDSPVLPKVETMEVLPKSPYAANKIAAEGLIRAYASCYEIDAASLRYFNIFGPRQNANSAYAAVIAAFAKSLLAGEKPVIFGDGEQSRDFTFVDNAVHANLLAARNEQRIGGEVMNVACGRKVTVNELAAKMAELLGRPELQAAHREPRAGDVAHSLADLAKVGQTIGYEPVVDYERGLDVTCKWYADTTA